ncbi:MAG TPA: RibD family protein [Methanofastidiosum sp.]|nr:RibD family protein [Methanofastidiosum sp.]
MKRPKIIMHNTMSIDSSVKNFECDIGLHYQVAGSYEADAHLIGSVTAKSGLEMYSGIIPPERESDFKKKDYAKEDKRPFWIIVDTKGLLKGIMHMYRRFEYCKDVIILLSKNSPTDYVNYLEDRDYDYILAGDDKIDFPLALDILYSEYNIRKILTDTGGTLNSVLLENGLIDEISLIVTPFIVGETSQYLFKSLQKNKSFTLELNRVEVLQKNYVFIRYNVHY